MDDFKCIKLPDTPTEDRYFGIEMEFLDMNDAERRDPNKLEDIERKTEGEPGV